MNRIFFVAIFMIIAGFTVWYGLNPILTTRSSHAIQPTLSAATLITPAKPMINFSLINTQNQSFKKADFLEHWTLLFFGYAQCPDICPRTLALVTELFKKELKNPPSNFRFIFVSLDPTTDTPSNLRIFLHRFNSSFMGLTGKEQEVNKLAEACRIYKWTDPATANTSQKIIDHSATLVLINPQGHLQAVFTPPHDAEIMGKDLMFLMQDPLKP